MGKNQVVGVGNGSLKLVFNINLKGGERVKCGYCPLEMNPAASCISRSYYLHEYRIFEETEASETHTMISMVADPVGTVYM